MSKHEENIVAENLHTTTNIFGSRDWKERFERPGDDGKGRREEGSRKEMSGMAEQHERIAGGEDIHLGGAELLRTTRDRSVWWDMIVAVHRGHGI